MNISERKPLLKKPHHQTNPCCFTFFDCILPLASLLLTFSIAIAVFALTSDQFNALQSTFALLGVIICSLQAAFSFIHLIFFNKHPWIKGSFLKKLICILGYILAYAAMGYLIYVTNEDKGAHFRLVTFMMTFVNFVTTGIDIFNSRLNCQNFYTDSLYAIFLIGLLGCILFKFSTSAAEICYGIIQFLSCLPIPLSFFCTFTNCITLSSNAIKVLVIVNIGILLTFYLYLENLIALLKTLFSAAKAIHTV